MKANRNKFSPIVLTGVVTVWMLLLCQACGEKKTEAASQFPNEIGNTWTYIDYDSNMLFTDDKPFRRDTIKITVTDTFRGKDDRRLYTHWRIMNPKKRPLGIDPLYPHDHHFYSDVSIYNDTVDIGWMSNPVFMRYIFPLQIGRLWTSDFYTISVIEKDTITVPAGTFDDCYRLRASVNTDSTMFLHLWFVPGIGQVKKVMHMPGRRLPGPCEELVAYHLAQRHASKAK